MLARELHVLVALPELIVGLVVAEAGLQTLPDEWVRVLMIFAETARRSVSPVSQSRVFLKHRMVCVSACCAYGPASCSRSLSCSDGHVHPGTGSFPCRCLRGRTGWRRTGSTTRRRCATASRSLVGASTPCLSSSGNADRPFELRGDCFHALPLAAHFFIGARMTVSPVSTVERGVERAMMPPLASGCFAIS